MSLPINIVGASARAAAFSAVRSGFSPWACDLFGDSDLRAVARFVELAPGSYPGGLLDALEKMPSAPVLYTGALERNPALLDRIASRHRLLGHSRTSLRKARDPSFLASILRACGLEPPPVRPGTHPPVPPTGWLRKPVDGGGGAGIVPAEASPPGSSPREVYYQKICRGLPCSSVHLARDAGCDLLGVTRQLVGEPWLDAPRFAWCGNVGPLELPRETRAALTAAGEALAAACGLRGLFGLDFLLDGPTVRPLELNPRYTAAVEILEHALSLRALELHAAAWGAPVVASPPAGSWYRKAGSRTPRPAVLGKAVIFAPEEIVVQPDIRRLQPVKPESLPTFADLPAPGTVIPRGRPVITVFAGGTDPSACLEALRHEQQVARSLFNATRRETGSPSATSADRSYFFL